MFKRKQTIDVADPKNDTRAKVARSAVCRESFPDILFRANEEEEFGFVSPSVIFVKPIDKAPDPAKKSWIRPWNRSKVIVIIIGDFASKNCCDCDTPSLRADETKLWLTPS